MCSKLRANFPAQERRCWQKVPLRMGIRQENRTELLSVEPVSKTMGFCRFSLNYTLLSFYTARADLNLNMHAFTEQPKKGYTKMNI